MENQHRLLYGSAVLCIQNANLTEVIEDIFEHYNKTKVEPDFIILPNSLKLKYNSYLAHCFIAEGRIDENKFIEYSLETSIN